MGDRLDDGLARGAAGDLGFEFVDVFAQHVAALEDDVDDGGVDVAATVANQVEEGFQLVGEAVHRLEIEEAGGSLEAVERAENGVEGFLVLGVVLKDESALFDVFEVLVGFAEELLEEVEFDGLVEDQRHFVKYRSGRSGSGWSRFGCRRRSRDGRRFGGFFRHRNWRGSGGLDSDGGGGLFGRFVPGFGSGSGYPFGRDGRSRSVLWGERKVRIETDVFEKGDALLDEIEIFSREEGALVHIGLDVGYGIKGGGVERLEGLFVLGFVAKVGEEFADRQQTLVGIRLSQHNFGREVIEPTVYFRKVSLIHRNPWGGTVLHGAIQYVISLSVRNCRSLEIMLKRLNCLSAYNMASSKKRG